jgi:hypothetical protein
MRESQFVPKLSAQCLTVKGMEPRNVARTQRPYIVVEDTSATSRLLTPLRHQVGLALLHFAGISGLALFGTACANSQMSI